MLDWLGKIDPNVVVGIVSALVAWLYHKARGDKQQDLRDLVYGTIAAEVHRIVDSPELHDKARALLFDAAWKGLDLLKVPKNATTNLLVSAAVETGMAELARLLAQKAIPKQLDAVADGVAAAVDAFTPPAKPTVPPLDIVVEETP